MPVTPNKKFEVIHCNTGDAKAGFTHGSCDQTVAVGFSGPTPTNSNVSDGCERALSAAIRTASRTPLTS